MLKAYPANLKPNEQGGFMAQFPDVPEALTEADTGEEVLKCAQDALAVALSGYLDDRKNIPRPSRPQRGQKLVALPPSIALKLAIYQAMRDQKLTQAELARRLGCNHAHVVSILDLNHDTPENHLCEALAVLAER
jgi:antitoxin HicB